jgi:hypothetical protein
MRPLSCSASERHATTGDGLGRCARGQHRTPGGRCAAGNTERRASVPEAVCVARAGTCPHGGAVSVAIAQHRFLVCRALRTLRSGVTPHQPTQITLGRQLQGSCKGLDVGRGGASAPLRQLCRLGGSRAAAKTRAWLARAWIRTDADGALLLRKPTALTLTRQLTRTL